MENKLHLQFMALLMALSLGVAARAASHLHSEAEYVDHYCPKINDVYVIEQLNIDKTRTDCYTPLVSYEFDFARKWYECIAQALYYAKLNNNQASCILIVEKPETEMKYVERATSTIKHYNLPVQVAVRYKY